MDVHDQAAYDELQRRLIDLWPSIQSFNNDPQTIVVVPNADVDVELAPSELQAYEERYLFLLLLLRQPNARMIYLTGQTIHPDIVEYYLDLLPGVIAGHARERLHLLSPMEATDRPLSRKILDRPQLVEQIRSLIVDHRRAHLVPFMTTWADRELAMRLDIPMYGADPKDAALGTKSSGRKLFAEVGITHPVGIEDLHTRADLVDAVQSIRRQRPDITRLVVKHNDGVSGFGNATMRLDGLPHAGAPDEWSAIDDRIDRLELGLDGSGVDHYLAMLEAEGGIVEEMIDADEITSPSAQLRVTPLGEVEVLSTHDQLLGGPTGQTFLGSTFPANPAYAVEIGSQAAAVGELLAARGVIGRFAIDFVAARTTTGWETHAIELNLRKGGTTHPFLTLQFLTDGVYDHEAGIYRTRTGAPRSYVASDHLDDETYRGLTPHHLFDVAMQSGLHFDHARQTGVVFHMMSALATHGRMGVTAVGETPDDAAATYDRVVDALAGAAAGTWAG